MTASAEADKTNLAMSVALQYMMLSSEHKLEQVSQLMTDTTVYKSDALRIEVTGRTPIHDMMVGFFAKYSDVTWEVTALKVDGTAVEGSTDLVRVEVHFVRRWTEPDTRARTVKAGREWITVNTKDGSLAGVHVAAFDA
eukprot:CAMPEP_0202858772 /NCGR_PEP_ID=MMETSP1391-20130828/1160_1 /ASSEMBLY_ACC=CAM_ASM_000867 /TAXON_ID=1034604 /ORGANISM="Chlamydomonas leiostraca, Strain SAG 11-49" /LENGTH=138 /DNA_ID=CAMNT_0049537725 /DNA_START=125 /DNA_END=541 /DNA_ORIENTATION=+